MINVLKRLAELDSGNPNIENRMTVDTPLATVSNVYEDMNSVEECGDMPAPSAAPHSAANISVTANSGDEVASMLKSLMALSGVSNTASMPSHKEIEVSSPHAVHTGNDDMARMISMIDNSEDHHDMTDDLLDLKKDNSAEEAYGDQQRMPGSFNSDGSYNTSDDEATDFDELDYDDDQEEKSEAMYDNSPEQEIEPHDYGDKQVTPKPQGFKQRIGDNPYKMAHESADAIATQLMNDYRSFVAEMQVDELSPETIKSARNQRYGQLTKIAQTGQRRAGSNMAHGARPTSDTINQYHDSQKRAIAGDFRDAERGNIYSSPDSKEKVYANNERDRARNMSRGKMINVANKKLQGTANVPATNPAKNESRK